MNMVWVAILTLIAGSTDGPSVGRDRDHRCLAANAMIKAHESGPGRSHTLARRVFGRQSLPPWSSPLVEEFDTQEVDETWMVDLDALTSIPVSWLSWARPRSTRVRTAMAPTDPAAILDIPLRC